MPEVVTTSRLKEQKSSDSWCGDGRHRDCWLPGVSSQRTPGPCWEQLSAHLVEVGQRKHGLRSRQVLGQTALSHFGKTPQLLDYAKGVFAASPGPRARPVDRPPALAQPPLGGRPSVDPVAHPPSLEKPRNSSAESHKRGSRRSDPSISSSLPFISMDPPRGPQSPSSTGVANANERFCCQVLPRP